MRLLSQSGVPHALRIDQSLEDGFRFRDTVFRPTAVGTPQKQGYAAQEAASGNAGTCIARLIFAREFLLVTFLGTLVFGLVFFGVRASSSVNYYYQITEPYMTEVRDRGMNMIRNADESGVAMSHIMREADGMASSAIPGLATTVNASLAAVDRLTRLAHNPVMKISVE
tara:strand:- start:3435 stop:3941 length:507 start_codon:yes stop_codon:yes gene_type:complete